MKGILFLSILNIATQAGLSFAAEKNSASLVVPFIISRSEEINLSTCEIEPYSQGTVFNINLMDGKCRKKDEKLLEALRSLKDVILNKPACNVTLQSEPSELGKTLSMNQCKVISIKPYEGSIKAPRPGDIELSIESSKECEIKKIFCHNNGKNFTQEGLSKVLGARISVAQSPETQITNQNIEKVGQPTSNNKATNTKANLGQKPK